MSSKEDEVPIEIMSIFQRRGVSQEDAINILWGLLGGIYGNMAKGMPIDDVERDIEEYKNLMSQNIKILTNTTN